MRDIITRSWFETTLDYKPEEFNISCILWKANWLTWNYLWNLYIHFSYWNSHNLILWFIQSCSFFLLWHHSEDSEWPFSAYCAKFLFMMNYYLHRRLIWVSTYFIIQHKQYMCFEWCVNKWFWNNCPGY